MTDKYFVCLEGGEGRVVEKKSEFIGELVPVHSEEEAAAFIETVKKKYWDARHHCYAYVLGDAVPQKKFSDDGEPSQTAGRPILDILENAGLHDVCCVVTRYFGGTLLGTGGLVRCYQGAAREAVNNSRIAQRIKGCSLSYMVDYDLYERIRRLSDTDGVWLMDTDFGEKVKITLATSPDNVDNLMGTIDDLSAGRAVLSAQEEREIIL